MSQHSESANSNPPKCDDLQTRATAPRETFAVALERFYFPPDMDEFVRPVRETAAATHQSFADAFASNLIAAISVAAMPYHMVESAVRQRRFQAVHSAQRIRSLKSEYKHMTDEERGRWAFEAAKDIFAQEIANDKRDAEITPLGQFASAVLSELIDSLRDPAFSESADELLRQCTVLCWGALEVLASDLFVAAVNSKPSLAGVLLQDARTKKYYEPRNFGSALEEHHYDLSSCMGDVLINQHRIDDVESIRSVFDVLSPSNASIRVILSDEKLWRLSQDRNLIVHRRAIVDRQYVAKTGSTHVLGTRLRIGPDLFENYLTYVRAAGIDMLSAFSN
jgi:hypothetical protein